jgi:hypothetical protein
MFYLAPGRRVASAAILMIACAIAAALLWALYGFGSKWQALRIASMFKPEITMELYRLGWLAMGPLLLALMAAVIVFFAWKRTRYFGNWSALLVFIVLSALVPLWGPAVLIWALPFAFVFVGGIWADLLERGYGRATILLLILAQEGLAIWTITRAAL